MLRPLIPIIRRRRSLLLRNMFLLCIMRRSEWRLHAGEAFSQGCFPDLDAAARRQKTPSSRGLCHVVDRVAKSPDCSSHNSP
mmetsp:Transcript_58558/g.130451  ORF Transcript_58558/g.130451 Transcript_58558/m.130451 type:complete len:82 (+) Transcript_58558:100-345(+)